MFKYEFKNENDEELCTLETTVDISEIIQEYRGEYIGSSKGYKNPKGCSDSDGYIYWDYFQPCFCVIKTKENGETEYVYPSLRYKDRKYYSGKSVNDCSRVDIRRIIGDVLYCLYIEKIFIGEVNCIKINNEEYKGIKNVSFVGENDQRIIFYDESDKKILIPISLDSKESKLYPFSKKGLFVLKDKNKNINLNIWEQRIVNSKNFKSYDKPYRDFYVDLFYGSYNEEVGIFFYFENEIKSLYTINKRSEITVCDLKCTFFISRYIKYSFDKDENIKYDDYKNLQNSDDIREKFIKLINEKFKKYVYSQKKIDNYSIIKSNNSNSYKVQFEFCNYIFDLTEVNVINTDLCIECQDLGRIEKGNVSIYLDSNLNNWIFEIMGYKVKKDILEKKIDNLSFPPVPDGKFEEKRNKIIYDLKYIDSYLEKYKEEFNKLFDRIENFKTNKDVMKFLRDNSLSQNASKKITISSILYPEPNIADDNVVNLIYETKIKYDKDQKLPNFAIMGGPGTGKSTIVKNIAKCLTGDNREELVLYKSTSDLKGAYIGHTGARMFDLIVNASKNDQIIFIDEAYSLQEDRFGQEALEICLPLLTGDRKYIEKPAMGNETEPQIYDFEKEKTKIPSIWFAGYEHEMRKMLSKNPGLYRRMKKISLPSPTVDGLYSCLLKKVGEETKSKLEECKNEIRNYFSWATSKENVSYFGNYAGVEDFKETCEIRLEGEKTNYKDVIFEIIDEKKKEIKKQYKAILEDVEKIKFEIQNEVDVTLEDVKGNDKIVSNLRDIVNMMLNQKYYADKGISLPKGALLVGPPGTGKTMLARAIAGEIQKNYREKDEKNVSIAFIATVATELDNPKKIKALFETASEYDLSIVFIDEIDAIGKHRNMPGAVPALLIQLMKELDGFEERKNLFVMAATNAPESLDPALKRPGRFDRNIEVTYPDKKGRKSILKSALMKLELFRNCKMNKNNSDSSENSTSVNNQDETPTVDSIAETIAEKTIQYTPANLVNLVNETAILYEKCNKEKNIPPHRKHTNSETAKFNDDILEMLERLNVGELNSAGKEDEFNTDRNEGCSAVAIHEVGHALVSILSDMEPFDRITIISRGDALGYVSPSSKNRLRTKKDFINQIRVCLGGRVAEEIFFGDNISTAAVQDIQQATQYAKNMITLFGMSDVIGMMALQTNEKSYLGESSSYICSDSFRYEVDDAIRKLLSEQMSITRNILETHKDEIKKMAQYIFEEETVTGKDFMKKYKNK